MRFQKWQALANDYVIVESTELGGDGEPSAELVRALCDRHTGVGADGVLVLGNQVTPIAVTLDGKPHSLTRSLEGVAAAVAPGARYTLQITGGSSAYGPVRSAGLVQLTKVRLSLPSVA